MAIPDRPFDVESAAKHLGCSPSHVRKLCREGRLRHFRLGGKLIRIPLSAIAELRERMRTEGIAFPSQTKRKHQPKAVSRIKILRAGLGRIAKEEDEKSFVYFIQGEQGGPIKIGTAEDVMVRLVTLQAASPVKLKIIGCVRGGRSLERAIHREFTADRKHFEWFEPSVNLIQFIEEALQSEGVQAKEYEEADRLYRSASVKRTLAELRERRD